MKVNASDKVEPEKEKEESFLIDYADKSKSNKKPKAPKNEDQAMEFDDPNTGLNKRNNKQLQKNKLMKQKSSPHMTKDGQELKNSGEVASDNT